MAVQNILQGTLVVSYRFNRRGIYIAPVNTPDCISIVEVAVEPTVNKQEKYGLYGPMVHVPHTGSLS